MFDTGDVTDRHGEAVGALHQLAPVLPHHPAPRRGVPERLEQDDGIAVLPGESQRFRSMSGAREALTPRDEGDAGEPEFDRDPMGGFVIDEIGRLPIEAVTLDPLRLDQQKVRESGEPIGAFDRTV